MKRLTLSCEGERICEDLRVYGKPSARPMFFHLSGSLILLSYAIHKQDPVFILGQSLGSIIYIRNLILIFRKKKALALASIENE